MPLDLVLLVERQDLRFLKIKGAKRRSHVHRWVSPAASCARRNRSPMESTLVEAVERVGVEEAGRVSSKSESARADSREVTLPAFRLREGGNEVGSASRRADGVDEGHCSPKVMLRTMATRRMPVIKPER